MKLVVEILLFSLIILLIAIGYFVSVNDIDELKAEEYIDPELNIRVINHNIYFVEQGEVVKKNANIIVRDNRIERSILSYISETDKQDLFLESIFGKGFTVGEIEIVNKTCFLNLEVDKNMLKQNIINNYAKHFIAVVNTLTETKDILNVQFLFNGEKITHNVFGTSFNRPFFRIEALETAEEEIPHTYLRKFLTYIKLERYDLAYGYLSSVSRNKYDFNEFSEMFQKYIELTSEYDVINIFSRQKSDKTVITYQYRQNNIVYKTEWDIIETNGFKEIILPVKLLEVDAEKDYFNEREHFEYKKRMYEQEKEKNEKLIK